MSAKPIPPRPGPQVSEPRLIELLEQVSEQTEKKTKVGLAGSISACAGKRLGRCSCGGAVVCVCVAEAPLRSVCCR